MRTERLIERLEDFNSAIARLHEIRERWLSSGDDGIRDGMIQRFEFTFELSWKSTRDWIRIWEADLDPNGPRQVFEAAVSRNIIADGNLWSGMLFDRNRTTHVYNEAESIAIAGRIAARYVEAFETLSERLSRDG